MTYPLEDSLILLFSFINLILIVFLIVLSFPVFKKRFSIVKKQTWILLSMIFLIGLVFRMFLVPHTTYNFGDEAHGISEATSIASHGQYTSCPNYDYKGNCIGVGSSMHPASHPLILALSFAIFGADYDVAFNTVALLGSTSIIMMFIFCLLFFTNERIALLSAFLLSLTPIHMFLSGTSEFRLTSILFILMTLSCFLLYLENESYRLLLLAFSLLAFTTQTMPEMILTVLFVAFIFVLFDKRFRQRMTCLRFWLCLALLFFLITPQMIKTATNLLNEPSWRVFSEVLSYQYLKIHLKENLGFWFLSIYHPPFMTLFALAALIIPWRIYLKQKVFLGTFFVILFLFYSSYSLGSFRGLVRYTLALYVPLVVLASLFVHTVTRNITKRSLAFLAVTGLSLSCLFVPNLRVKSFVVNSQTAEFEFLRNSRAFIDKDCYILALRPYLITPATHIPSYSIRNVKDLAEINNIIRDRSCVLFYKGLECQSQTCDTARDTFGKILCHDRIQLFQKIKMTYNITNVTSTKIDDIELAFYRMK